MGERKKRAISIMRCVGVMCLVFSYFSLMCSWIALFGCFLFLLTELNFLGINTPESMVFAWDRLRGKHRFAFE